MTGYVFVRKGTEFLPTQDFVIQVGGDTRYGLGRLRCVDCEENTTVFGFKVELGHDDPSISSRAVLAHAVAPGSADAEPRAALKLLSGWNRDHLEPLGNGQPLWAPGSSWQQELSWVVAPQGIWKLNTPRV